MELAMVSEILLRYIRGKNELQWFSSLIFSKLFLINFLHDDEMK